MAGEIYILDVWVGARTDYYAGDAGTYSSGKISSIDVVVGGNTFYAVGTPPTPGSGLFSMWTVTFSGAAGQDATVNLGPALSGSQADYADLFLDPSFTPEPGFYGALALGLGGLIGAGRLRRAKQ